MEVYGSCYRTSSDNTPIIKNKSLEIWQIYSEILQSVWVALYFYYYACNSIRIFFGILFVNIANIKRFHFLPPIVVVIYVYSQHCLLLCRTLFMPKESNKIYDINYQVCRL